MSADMANAATPLREAERRAWRYWLVDGLPQLLAGFLCILIAVPYLLLYPHSHSRPSLFFVAALVIYGLYAIIFFRLRETLERLKARITYPRTGYVTAPPFSMGDLPQRPALTIFTLKIPTEKEANEAQRARKNRNRRVWLLVLVPVAWIASALMHRWWMCAAAGLAAGLGIWLAALRDEQMSMAVVFWMPWVGFAMVQLSSPLIRPLQRTGFLVTGIGASLAAAGMLTLMRYLLRNPVHGR
jgi:hypothetical protein